MINGQKDTYDYVAEAVRDYWSKTHPQDMVAFFEQKYDDPYDKEWIKEEEIVMWCGDLTDRLEFLNDFNEGQTMIRNLEVVPLDDVLQFYRQHKIESEKIEYDVAVRCIKCHLLRRSSTLKNGLCEKCRKEVIEHDSETDKKD